MILVGTVSQQSERLCTSSTMSPLPLLLVCHDLHFCKTVTTNDRVLYKRFVSGLMAAFFGYYVQGNDQQLQYLLKANLMPVPVTDLKSDLNC